MLRVPSLGKERSEASGESCGVWTCDGLIFFFLNEVSLFQELWGVRRIRSFCTTQKPLGRRTEAESKLMASQLRAGSNLAPSGPPREVRLGGGGKVELGAIGAVTKS